MASERPKRASMLLLEDDAQLAEMIVLTLSDEFEIERAANADEAKLLLGARSFDLLLCDHMMPGKQQGLDFLVYAMEHHPAPRRILMTGYMNPDMLGRSVTVAGLSACLLKPFDMRELRRRLHECLAAGK